MQKHPHYEALIEMKYKAFENKSEVIGRCGGALLHRLNEQILKIEYDQYVCACAK